MMNKLILALCLVSPLSLADSIRTSDGTSCTSDTNNSPFEVETYVEGGNSQDEYFNSINSMNQSNNNQAGIKLTYRFGGPKRLACDKLYKMELETKRLELQLLRKKLKMMEAGKAANWD